jgi:hypothetical protein
MFYAMIHAIFDLIKNICVTCVTYVDDFITIIFPLYDNVSYFLLLFVSLYLPNVEY